MINQKEIERITLEIRLLNTNGFDKGEIKESLRSEILSREELDFLIERKVAEHQVLMTNGIGASKTILGSVFGISLGSVLGSILLILTISFVGKLVFLPIVGVYILCYFTIKFFTYQSGNNLIVFIASFLSTVISTLLALAVTLLL